MELKKIAENFYQFEAKAPVKPALAQISINTKSKVLNYGDKNNFPQELIRAINNSPTARAATKSHSKIIAGDGFLFPEEYKSNEFYKALNRAFGKTFLPSLSYDYSYFEAIALHLRFNMNGKIVSIKHVDVSTLRLDEPDDQGVIRGVKISADWENLTGKGNTAKINAPISYDLYDPLVIRERMQLDPESFAKWNGAIVYARRYAPGQPYYPIPSWTSSLNWVYVDGEIQNFHANNLDNAFMPSVLVYVPGELKGTTPDGKDKKEAFKEKIQSLSGSENGGEPVILYGKEGAQPTIEQFTANTNHELFIALSNLSTEHVMRAFQIPPILAGIKVAGQLGTSNEIANAIELYYNTVAKDDVNFIEGVLNPLIAQMENYPGGEVSIANSKPFNFIDSAFKDAFTIGEIRESAGYSYAKPIDNTGGGING